MAAEANTIERAKLWLAEGYDEQTRAEVQRLIDENGTELEDAFYRDLEFGTGGLRGVMGVGTNRVNIYTIAKATQGLANYIKKQFPGEKEIKLAVACDCRNNSQLFTDTTAEIFSANGFYVYKFESLRPTPELSYAVRELGCKGGVVITASHNPKEYNGYKAYWADGGQLIEPHDTNVIEEVMKITDNSQIKFGADASKIEIIGEAFDKKYVQELTTLSLQPELIKKHKDLKIVFTPIHGTAVKLVPMALKAFGFENIINVPEQDLVSGDFPTVISPNPEDKAALSMAIEKAKETGAELVMATDPDADRVGVVVKTTSGEYVILNGNQTGALLVDYLVKQWKNTGKLLGKEYIIKTIVTTELLKDIAGKYNVECFDVLTGFKYIAEKIKALEGVKKFIGGGEESYGYLAGEFVREKDAVMACALIAEAAAAAKEAGLTLFEQLLDIYLEYGFYKEDLLSVTKKGKAGAEEIAQMMFDFRSNPPKEISGSAVVTIKDYQSQIEKCLKTGTEIIIDLPKSNVLQFFTEDGSKVSIRPSGTEPKIKFYFGVKGSLASAADYAAADKKLADKIESIKKSLNL
jgi:phosphoglucomutase